MIDCIGNVMPANLTPGEMETWNLCAHAAKCGNTAGILGLSIIQQLRLELRIRELEARIVELESE